MLTDWKKKTSAKDRSSSLKVAMEGADMRGIADDFFGGRDHLQGT